MPAPWFEQEIAASVASRLADFSVEVLPEIDSTNSELMRRAREGLNRPLLLAAERQTAGRGRLGRPWQSAQQQREPASLTFSLGLPLAPRDWSGLSLAVGVSVAESLDANGSAGIAIKWPNDLWREERKLCGILIETALMRPDVAERFLIVGIGINIEPREAGAGQAYSTAPAWVQEFRPQATAGEVLLGLVAPLVRDVQSFEQSGFVPFASRYAARDLLRGREVRLSDGSEGRCEGVGWGGELLLRGADGLKNITSSEVSVRPRPARP